MCYLLPFPPTHQLFIAFKLSTMSYCPSNLSILRLPFLPYSSFIVYAPSLSSSPLPLFNHSYIISFTSLNSPIKWQLCTVRWLGYSTLSLVLNVTSRPPPCTATFSTNHDSVIVMTVTALSAPFRFI